MDNINTIDTLERHEKNIKMNHEYYIDKIHELEELIKMIKNQTDEFKNIKATQKNKEEEIKINESYYIDNIQKLKEYINISKHMNHLININIILIMHLHQHLLNTFVKNMAYHIMLLISIKLVF